MGENEHKNGVLKAAPAPSWRGRGRWKRESRLFVTRDVPNLKNGDSNRNCLTKSANVFCFQSFFVVRGKQLVMLAGTRMERIKSFVLLVVLLLNYFPIKA